MPYLPAPVLAPFLTQEECEIFGVPPANLQIFTPRLLNPSWLISLRVPCLARLPEKTPFVQLESLTVDQVADIQLLALFTFPMLRKFSTTVTQGCPAVSVALEIFRATTPQLHSLDLLHSPSVSESMDLEISKNYRHFSVVGCAACSLKPGLGHLRSLGVSISSKFPKKFPTINEKVEKLHVDFLMVWRQSLGVLDRDFPNLKELTVSGPVFGDGAKVLGRLLGRFDCLKRLQLSFRDTAGSPVLGLLKELEGTKINVEH